MKKQSKRYRSAKKLVIENKIYSVEDAVDILKKMPAVKFDETVEISCKLSVDLKQTDQAVRGSVLLPHGTGKTTRVLVFCEPEKEVKAKEAGADYIGTNELIDKILKDGWTEFDCCVSTPGMMRNVSKLGKFLGPRGLMPSPKNGTVTENVTAAIKEVKQGKIDFRMDKTGCLHVGLGKLSFSKQALVENVKAFIEALNAAKPSTVTELYKALYLSTTMSPSLVIQL